MIGAHICTSKILFCQQTKFRSVVPTDRLVRHFQIASCMVTSVSMSMQFHRWASVIGGDQHGLSLWHGISEQLLRLQISCFEAMMLPIARGVRSLSIAEHCAHVCVKSHVSSLCLPAVWQQSFTERCDHVHATEATCLHFG